ncbi:glycine cleavage T C-terminal barrel domain-containing protein [Pseudophaeobacter sp.]|uniref:glycine cleavage T C-terminal barrel domain-containing protein n=1 Tax=Pseudophaeobacter sp. TaxID=1971739 RepID=UPI0032988A65
MGVMEGGGAGWFLAHWMTHGAPPMDALAVDSRRFGSWADRDYRVAKAVECFGLQFGVHYPNEERPAGRGLRLSPLHDMMVERGAVMGAAYGWERPNWFSETPEAEAEETFCRANWFDAVAQEVAAATNRVAMADLSVFSKFDVTGPDVASFLEALGANHAVQPGRIGLTHALTSAGGVLSEFTVTRLAPDHAYLTSAAAAEQIDFDLLTQVAKGFEVTVSNVCEKLAVIGIMGPKSPDVLPELSDMPWLTARETNVGGVHVRALRVSYLGECGWELHVSKDQAVGLFTTLEEAAKPHGLGYYGAYAANSMRLEKGYRSWGSDLTTERSPLEAGLAPFVRKPLHAELTRDAAWDMVMLEIEAGEVDPFYAHTVWKDGLAVGIATSGAYGHRTGKVLALAYLRDPTAGDGLTISILGRQRAATILPSPPFDPNNLRLKTRGSK